MYREGLAEDQIRAGEVAVAGAESVLFTPLFDQAEQIEVLAEAVVSRPG